MKKIGIDFGTTNSAAGYIGNNELETSLRPMPSLVSYSQGSYKFGDQAMSVSRDLQNQSLIISNLKPKLGRAPVHIVGDMKFKPEELASKYLVFLTENLLALGIGEVSEELGAVIGTPVKYPPSHRKALLNAAKKAGFKSVEFVYEPTAAIFYALSRLAEYPKGPVAVIDWGGGTVDITIVKCGVNPKRIEDLDVNAREHGLGGKDLDVAILDATLEKSDEARNWFDGADRSVKNALLGDLEDVKIEFLENGDFPESEGDFSRPSMPVDIQQFFVLLPETILDCVNSFTRRVASLAVETTKSAELSVEDVEHFLLVGGPCRSVIVRDKLSKIWPRARELTVEDRQMATARGCTMLAESGFDLALAADVVVRQFDDQHHHVLNAGQKFDRYEKKYREYKYRVTDLSSPQAVFEIGYMNQVNNYKPLEIVSVPVMHLRDDERRQVIPFDVLLRLGLDENLYVTAEAVGRAEISGVCKEVRKLIQLSSIPLALSPRGNWGRHS